MTNPEHYKESIERSQEAAQATAEHKAELAKERPGEERGKVESREQELQEARFEAHKEAKATDQYATAEEESEKAKQPFVASAERERSYRQTLDDIQIHMSAPSRSFSKVIHNKTVEKISDAVGSTVARPNAILAGAVCAFLLVLGVYVHARYNGYALRGSETIAAFTIGWLAGLLFDLLRGLFRGRR